MTQNNSNVSLEVSRFLPVKVALGKPDGTGSKVEYATIALDVATWNAGNFVQWLTTGVARVVSDTIAGAKTKSGGLSGRDLIEYKRKMAADFIAGLADANRMPGRNPASNSGRKPGKVADIAHYLGLVSIALVAEDFPNMSADEFTAHLERAATRMRNAAIVKAGGDPATYDNTPDAAPDDNGREDGADSNNEEAGENVTA